jgi:hypothetical protein
LETLVRIHRLAEIRFRLLQEEAPAERLMPHLLEHTHLKVIVVQVAEAALAMDQAWEHRQVNLKLRRSISSTEINMVPTEAWVLRKDLVVAVAHQQQVVRFLWDTQAQVVPVEAIIF